MRKQTFFSLVCADCGRAFTATRSTAEYCSAVCRGRRRHRGGQLAICQRPSCAKPFTIGSQHRYCSPICGEIANQDRRRAKGKSGASEISVLIRHGIVAACLVYFIPCTDCSRPITSRYKRAGKIPCCAECSRRRYQAHNAKKNHKRRAAGPKVISVHELAARDGAHCHICQHKVNLNLSGMAKWGPTIDHLLPVSLGGTNSPENLALAHRHCNIARGNRGGAQLLLIAN